MIIYERAIALSGSPRSARPHVVITPWAANFKGENTGVGPACVTFVHSLGVQVCVPFATSSSVGVFVSSRATSSSSSLFFVSGARSLPYVANALHLTPCIYPAHNAHSASLPGRGAACPPAIGRPNAEILHHGPPPAYARGQAAVGGVARLAAGVPRPAFLSAWGERPWWAAL